MVTGCILILEVREFEAPCLRVPKVLGEKAIGLARKLGLLNHGLRIQRVRDLLYIPLTVEPSPAQIEEIEVGLPESEICVYMFPERARCSLKLVDALEGRLAPSLLERLPRSMDFIGGIAVVEIPPELEGYKRVIGETVLAMHKRVHTVLAKAGAVGGLHRLREFEVVAGAAKTETAHREHGCTYHLDPTEVYFSPRLSYEHHRVASQVGVDETVIDMFAGVGPFSILIAKERKNVRVYAIDVNPKAASYLKRNIRANRVQGKVVPILGDVRDVVEKRLTGTASRAIMNLPERAIEYVDAACKAIKPGGGIIHYYEFASAPNPLEAAKSRLAKAVKGANRIIRKILLARVVREVAPLTWQVAVDAEIQ